MMDTETQDKILAVARCGMTSAKAIGYFRVAVGLVYLDGIMTEEKLDFKKLDREFNRFIYHSIGKGHTITSVLQYMSGKKVVDILQSDEFMDAFKRHCNQIAPERIPFLLSVNLTVAKNISGLPNDGPVKDWIGWHAK